MIAYKRVLFIFSMLLIVLITGCGSSKESEEQEEKSVPRELKSIEENIENILANLSDPSLSEKDREDNKTEGKQQSESEGAESEKKLKDQKKSESENSEGEQGDSGNKMKEGQEEGDDKKLESSEKSKEESGNSKQGSEKSGKEESGGKIEDPKESEQEKSQANWKEIEKSIKEIHSVWNSYLPKAKKDGVSSRLTDDFSNNLNKATGLSSDKSNASLLLAMNELYSFIPDALSSYDSPVPPGVKKAKYYARSVVYNANSGDWDKASDDAEKLDSIWSSTMNSIGKKLKEEAEKLEYSIKDLMEVTKMQSKQLVFIKGEITMGNIKDIEKTLEDQAKEEKSKEGKKKM